MLRRMSQRSSRCSSGGIFYEGWDPAKTPMRMSLTEFLSRVEKEAGLKGTSEAEKAVRAVMAVCRAELGEGTLGDQALGGSYPTTSEFSSLAP